MRLGALFAAHIPAARVRLQTAACPSPYKFGGHGGGHGSRRPAIWLESRRLSRRINRMHSADAVQRGCEGRSAIRRTTRLDGLTESVSPVGRCRRGCASGFGKPAKGLILGGACLHVRVLEKDPPNAHVCIEKGGCARWPARFRVFCRAGFAASACTPTEFLTLQTDRLPW